MLTNTHEATQADLNYAAPSLLVLNSEWMADHLGHPQRSIIVRPPVDPALYETTPGDLVTQISLTEGKGGHLFWALARAMSGTRFLAVLGSYGDQLMPTPVPPNVTVAGPFDGRRMRDQVYARTRILLVPSDYESWGRVATEAMCSGIPVIAHRAQGGLAENLGDAAIWADRDDPGTWVREITRLGKRAAWEKASEASRKRSAELDPAADLERWVEAVEALVP
jgi:glycosyltransferase involved in cell wall biosynthesis